MKTISIEWRKYSRSQYRATLSDDTLVTVSRVSKEGAGYAKNPTGRYWHVEYRRPDTMITYKHGGVWSTLSDAMAAVGEDVSTPCVI